MKRGPVIGALVIGLGLIAAPIVFQMFSRAPMGGDMIEAFTPYMTEDQIGKFQGYIAQISEANDEIVDSLRPQLDQDGGVDAAQFDSEFVSVAEFNDEWPAIDADMSDMLNTMDENRDNFDDVTALPDFPLFPWFFAIPGAIIAVVAALTLRGDKAGRDQRRMLRALAGLGVALILAPAVFQMFTRAPSGAQMIEEFEPLMTRDRVLSIQGYFVTIGAMEGQLRTSVEPLAESETDYSAGELPAIDALHEDWSTIFTDFAPMIGTMSDNVTNFQAVVALPPFDLFPWFFVIPGLLLIGMAVWAGRGDSRLEPDPTESSKTETDDPEPKDPETVDVPSAANP